MKKITLFIFFVALKGYSQQNDTISGTNMDEIIIQTHVQKNGSSATKMPLKDLESSQILNVVTKETLKEQNITSYDDALRNAPGITKAWASTGRSGDGGAYFSLRGFEAQPGLVNGLPGLVSGNLDPANIEEIQIIKGPSGTLFGASFYGYGGIINTVTKKPYDTFGVEVGYNIGSFGLHRLTADINTPLNKSKKIYFRLNTALHTENSFQDAGFKKSLFVAPSFLYKVNDKLTISLLTEILEEKRAIAPVFFTSDRTASLDFKNLDQLQLNYKKSFISDDLTIRNPRMNLQAQALYQINSIWNSQTVLSAGTVKSVGLYSYIWQGVDYAKEKMFNQYFSNQNDHTTTFDIQQNFNADFNIGNLRNRLLVGFDYFSRTVTNKSSGYISTRLVTPQGDSKTLNSENPSGLDKDYILNELAKTKHTDSKITNSALSAYVSDVINVTPALSFMGSIRMDYFSNSSNDNSKDYNQLTFSPKFGVVYQPILDKVSIFANYMNAFYNVAPQQIFDNNQQPLGIKKFKPQMANQIEVGTKTNLLSNKLNATFSLYNTIVSNRVYYSPTSAIQGGKVQSKGFELELNAHPTPQISLLAGFSHGKIEITEGNSATPSDFYNEKGRVPGGQGPQTLANFWGTYKFISGSLKNFGVGFGGNYAGVNKVIDNSVTGVFELPSYVLLNAGIFYNAEKFRITANVNNLTNQEYYIGYWSVNPQVTRNFVVNATYKF